MSGDGTEASPFTHADGRDRRRKWCLCSACGLKAQCTPTTDFWGKDGKPLRCEPCFDRELALAHPGARIIDLREDSGERAEARRIDERLKEGALAAVIEETRPPLEQLLGRRARARKKKA